LRRLLHPHVGRSAEARLDRARGAGLLPRAKPRREQDAVRPDTLALHEGGDPLVDAPAADLHVSRRQTVALLCARFVLGIALRLTVAVAGSGKSFADNAVVALMALHALRGKFYTFYWGQAYMGSLESIVVAPFFACFGVGDVALSAGLLPWYVVHAAALFF